MTSGYCSVQYKSRLTITLMDEETEAQKSPTQIVAECPGLLFLGVLSLYHATKILFVTKNLRNQFVKHGRTLKAVISDSRESV